MLANPDAIEDQSMKKRGTSKVNSVIKDDVKLADEYQ